MSVLAQDAFAEGRRFSARDLRDSARNLDFSHYSARSLHHTASEEIGNDSASQPGRIWDCAEFNGSSGRHCRRNYGLYRPMKRAFQRIVDDSVPAIVITRPKAW